MALPLVAQGLRAMRRFVGEAIERGVLKSHDIRASEKSRGHGGVGVRASGFVLDRDLP